MRRLQPLCRQGGGSEGVTFAAARQAAGATVHRRMVGRRLARLAERDREQARAEQHKACRGDCQESIGYEVVIKHGAPPHWMLVRFY